MALADDQSELLKRMESIDVDIRYMAIKDFTKMLNAAEYKVDRIRESEFVVHILHLLHDKNSELQNLAVNCLGPLCNKITHEQLTIILGQLKSNILKGDAHTRSIHSHGLKTITKAISTGDSSVSQLVAKEMVPTLIQTMSSEANNVDVVKEAYDLLNEMFNCIGALLIPYQSDIVECALRDIDSTHGSLRKRACGLLSTLACYISPTELGIVFGYLLNLLVNVKGSCNSVTLFAAEQRTIMSEQRPRLALQLDQAGSAESTLPVVSALSVTVDHLNRAPSFIEPVLQLLLWVLQEQNRAGEAASDDLMELLLKTLETLLCRCPNLHWLPEVADQLYESLQHGASYDIDTRDVESISVDDAPGNEVDHADDEDEDLDCFSDDDGDSSWKVRRAAVRAMEMLIVKHPEMIPNCSSKLPVLLTMCFKEPEESLRQNYVSCVSATLHLIQRPYANLVTRQYTIDAFVDHEFLAQLENHNSPQSHLLSMLPSLLDIIKPFMASTVPGSGSSSGTVDTALQILRDLALALPGCLTDHLEPLVKSLYAIFKLRDASVSSNNTLKINIINVLATMVHSHPHDSFRITLSCLVEMTCRAIDDTYDRVAIEGLELLQLVVKSPFIGPQGHAAALFNSVSCRLQTGDKNTVLMEKLVLSISVLIAYWAPFLGKELPIGLNCLQSQLTSDVTRLAAVRGIQTIVSSTVAIDLSKFMPIASNDVSGFLSKNDRVLRLATLRCLYIIWLRCWKLVGPNCLTNIFQLVPELLIGDQDLQTSQLLLHLLALLVELAVRPNTVGSPPRALTGEMLSSDAFVRPLVTLAHSFLLRDQTLEAMIRLLQAIGRFDPGDHTLTTVLLTRLLAGQGSELLRIAPPAAGATAAQVHPSAHPSLARCIASLLVELPANLPGQTESKPDSVDSLNTAIDRLIAAAKNATDKPMQVRLNLLILGELGRKRDLSGRPDTRQVLLSCLSLGSSPGVSEEIRPAAALSLGRLTVGSPYVFLPALIGDVGQLVQTASGGVPLNSPGAAQHQEQQQLYYLLQAIKELLLHLAGNSKGNAVLEPQLDTVWSILLSAAGLPEEGTRHLVSECFGLLVLVKPKEHLLRLCSQVNSTTNSEVRATLILAMKFIVGNVGLHTAVLDDDPISYTWYDDVEEGNRPSQGPSAETLRQLDECLRCSEPSPLLVCLSYLQDKELPVRRAVLVTLNTAAHYQARLLRNLLCMPLLPAQPSSEAGPVPTLLSLLYQQTEVRPELIRVIFMGPFKHSDDDGLELRKCAFECMLTLLDTCIDKLDLARFLDTLIIGLIDVADIKLLSHHMLQLLASHCPVQIGLKAEGIAAGLSANLLTSGNQDWVKQGMEKRGEVTRSAMAVFVTLCRFPDVGKNPNFASLMSTVKANPSLWSLYREMEHNPAGGNASLPSLARTLSSSGRRRSSFGRLPSIQL